MKFRPYYLIKRLQPDYRHRRALKILPNNVTIESAYNKYFAYPLPELLVDHSTDPMQNTARQYIQTDSPQKERFINHQMIIRKNGESRILRPQRDRILDYGFGTLTRSFRPLSSHSSMPVPSAKRSLSIINKLSLTKSKLKKCTTRKQKRNHRHQSELDAKEVLRDVKNESHCRHYQQRVPFRDLSSKCSNHHAVGSHRSNSSHSQNRKLIQELEDICFNRHSTDQLRHSIECSFDLPTIDDLENQENSRPRYDRRVTITN